MNEQTMTPAPEELVPVPVPAPVSNVAPSAPEPALHASLEVRPARRPPSEDQLPTARLQSIPPLLPPPVPPQGPAHKTQPLRPITRDAAAVKLAAEAKRHRWQTVLGHVKRAAAAVPSPMRIGALRSEAWTEPRVGAACAVLGVAMIVGSLVLGWLSVAADRFDRVEHVAIAVAVVLARSALAIATMAVGYGLLRIGERTLLGSARSDSSARAR